MNKAKFSMHCDTFGSIYTLTLSILGVCDDYTLLTALSGSNNSIAPSRGVEFSFFLIILNLKNVDSRAKCVLD